MLKNHIIEKRKIIQENLDFGLSRPNLLPCNGPAFVKAEKYCFFWGKTPKRAK
jgi:hypothetical protein